MEWDEIRQLFSKKPTKPVETDYDRESPLDTSSPYYHKRDMGFGNALSSVQKQELTEWFLSQGWNETAARSIVHADLAVIRSRVFWQTGQNLEDIID